MSNGFTKNNLKCKSCVSCLKEWLRHYCELSCKDIKEYDSEDECVNYKGL